MVKKRGLGKSLDALLAYTNSDLQAAETVDQAEQEKIAQLPLHQVQRGKYQPRRDMDPHALEELAHSIRAQGVLQPLIVRPIGSGHYEIIAGERRWRAAQLAGLETVPAIIRPVPDEAAIAIALIENIQRENLNPIEEAVALQRLGEEFGFTHQQTAEAVGKSRTSVTNLLRLLSLPEEVKSLLDRKLIEMGHARALLPLPYHLQIDAAETIVARQMSVRDAEHLARRLQTPQAANPKDLPLDPHIERLQTDLAAQLKLRVAIQYNAKGKGKLVIHYRSLAELNGLLLQFQNG
jgi:ParB family chromosome partitioning protein